MDQANVVISNVQIQDNIIDTSDMYKLTTGGGTRIKNHINTTSDCQQSNSLVQ